MLTPQLLNQAMKTGLNIITSEVVLNRRVIGHFALIAMMMHPANSKSTTSD